jgi:spermidine synthase
VDLFATYTGQKADLAAWLRGAEINRDGDLRLQYIAGWGINSDMADYLYRQMLRDRRPPVNLFTGSPASVQSLFVAMFTDGIGTR